MMLSPANDSNNKSYDTENCYPTPGADRDQTHTHTHARTHRGQCKPVHRSKGPNGFRAHHEAEISAAVVFADAETLLTYADSTTGA